MKRIPLTQGNFAIVDDEDYEWLMQYKWRVIGKKSNVNCWYAIKGDYNKRTGQKSVLMHRLIMSAPNNKHIDHIDGNGLNNQRSNLRLCSHAQNIRNQRIQSVKKSSKYKGVCFYKAVSKWTAHVHINKKKYHLGYFNSEIEAAKAYDKKAIELFGQFANTNFKQERDKSCA